MFLRARKSKETFKLRFELNKKECNKSDAKSFKELFIFIPKTWNAKDCDRILKYKPFKNVDVVIL